MSWDLDVRGPGCPGPECPGPVCPGPGCPPVSVLWWSFSNFQSIFFNNKNQHWMVDSKNFHLSLQLVSNTSWTFRVCVWSTDVYCTYLALFSFSPLDDKISWNCLVRSHFTSSLNFIPAGIILWKSLYTHSSVITPTRKQFSALAEFTAGFTGFILCCYSKLCKFCISTDLMILVYLAKLVILIFFSSTYIYGVLKFHQRVQVIGTASYIKSLLY